MFVLCIWQHRVLTVLMYGNVWIVLSLKYFITQNTPFSFRVYIPSHSFNYQVNNLTPPTCICNYLPATSATYTLITDQRQTLYTFIVVFHFSLVAFAFSRWTHRKEHALISNCPEQFKLRFLPNISIRECASSSGIKQVLMVVECCNVDMGLVYMHITAVVKFIPNYKI